QQIKVLSRRTDHKLLLGDCRTIKVPRRKFSAMITSPPYPNYRDYSTMFAPENAFVELIKQAGLLSLDVQGKRLIGSPRVSEKDGYRKRTIEDVQSTIAKKFITDLRSVKCSKSAKYDNDIYYIPYFCNYFYDMEIAYQNISKTFSDDFEGYIVVVNNTARKKVIPVAEAIIEI